MASLRAATAVHEETKASVSYDVVGDLTFKGKADPVRVFEVVKPS